MNNKKMIEVVAAVIVKDNMILATQRGYGEFKGKWEFPGGKVEPNEDELDAIEREIKEEFEINIKAIEYLVNNVCMYPNKTVDLRLYECMYISGDFILHDHSVY